MAGKRGMTIERRKAVYGYIFVAPFAVGTLLFLLYPMIKSIQFSLSTYDNLTDLQAMRFVGIQNFVKAFTIDVEFVPKFLNVVRDMLINTPLVVLFSLILAICLNKPMKGRAFFRTVFLLPFILGSGLIFKYMMFSGENENAMVMVNGILTPPVIGRLFGDTVNQVFTVFLERITLVLWKSGLQILLFLSGLQSIPDSLYESARCDSATEWEMFWKITIPMMTPVILINIVYTIVDQFNDINNAMMTYFEFTMMQMTRFDYAAAMSLIYMAFVLLTVGLVFLVMRRFVFYHSNRS